MQWRREVSEGLKGAVAAAGPLARAGVDGALSGARRVGGWLATDARQSLARVFESRQLTENRPENSLADLAEDVRYTALSNRMKSLAALDEIEQARLHAINCSDRRTYQAGSEIAAEGEAMRSPLFVVSGWASRISTTGGGRQILGLLLPGDGIGLRRTPDLRPTSTVTAITTVEVVDATALLDIASRTDRFPGVAAAVERTIAQQAAFADNQIIRLGALSPMQRVANLLMELHWRQAIVGLATRQDFAMPLTCETLGDTLAMQPGRVRRVIGELRNRNMLSLKYGRARILSDEKAAILGRFQPPDLGPPPRRKQRLQAVGGSSAVDGLTA